jgi:hypothetical protein
VCKLKKREVLAYLLACALATALIFSTYSGITINNSLQACLEKNRKASAEIAMNFHLCLGRATDIEYLLRTYRKGFSENELNEDNIEALIEGFFHEMWYSWWFLSSLKDLNPELSEYEKPLYFIDRFVLYTIIGWQSFTAGPTVQSVLAHLLTQAQTSGNYSISLTAFKEFNQTTFQEIDELGTEVFESFSPFNATRLDNTVNMVEELQAISGQWIDKYS